MSGGWEAGALPCLNPFLSAGLLTLDPTREALDRSFTQTAWRESLWDGSYYQDHSSATHCTEFFEEQATTALAATDANYTEGDTVRHLFGDCTYAKLGVPCPVSTADGDVAVCNNVDMGDSAGTDAEVQAQCDAVTTGMGCIFTPPGSDTPAACAGRCT